MHSFSPAARFLILGALAVISYWPLQSGGDAGNLAFGQVSLEPATRWQGAPPRFAPPPAGAFIDNRRFLPEGLRRNVWGPNRGMTLRDMASLLLQDSGLNVVLDKASLEEEGISGDEEITLPGRLPWSLALGHALENVNDVPLTWYLDRNVVYITTQADAESKLLSHTFTIPPMKVHWQDEPPPMPHLLMLVHEHSQASWVDDWDEESEGAIDVMGNLLIVRQNWEAMGRVASVLEALNTPGNLIWLHRPQEDQRVLAALEMPAPIVLTGRTMPLRDLVALVAQEFNGPVKLDHAHLGEEGITGDEAVRIELAGQSLGEVLRWSLRNVNDVALTAIADRGMLSITTQSYSDTCLHSVVVDVGDLVLATGRAELVTLALNQSDGIWQDDSEDGEGGRIHFTPDDRLIVSQTDAALVELFELLRQIRSQLDPQSLAPRDPATVVTRHYHLSRPIARSLVDAIPQQVDPPSWITRGNEPPIGRISLVALDELPDPAPGAPLQRAPAGAGYFQIGAETPGPWPGHQPVPPDPQAVLVIRQTLANHNEIDRLIFGLVYGQGHAWWYPSPVGNQGFGGGWPASR